MVIFITKIGIILPRIEVFTIRGDKLQIPVWRLRGRSVVILSIKADLPSTTQANKVVVKDYKDVVRDNPPYRKDLLARTHGISIVNSNDTLLET